MLLFPVYETKRPAAVQTSCCLDKTAGEELLATGGEPWVKLLLILSHCLITAHPRFQNKKYQTGQKKYQNSSHGAQ